MRVGEEEIAARRDEQAHRREILGARREAQNIFQMLEPRVETSLEAAEQRIGIAAAFTASRDDGQNWCAPKLQGAASGVMWPLRPEAST